MDSAMRIAVPAVAEQEVPAVAGENGRVGTIARLSDEWAGKAAPDEPVVPEQKTPYPWILNPAIDIIFCCGGLLWIVFLAHLMNLGFRPASESAGMVLMAILGTHVLSESHTAATLFRLYSNDETRRKLSFHSKQAAVACIVLGAVAMQDERLAGLFTKIYLIWVVQHFLAQTYGIALIYCYKRGYIMNNFEKYAFKLMIDCTTCFAILRQFTYKEWGSDTFLGQQLPFWGLVPEPVFLVMDFVLKVSVALFAYVVIAKALREGKLFPLPAMLLTITGVVMFVLGKEVTGALWLYVPAFYHGSQYLVVSTAYYLKEKGLPENVSPSQIGSLLKQPTALKYLCGLLVLGVFMYVGIPGILEQMGFQFTTAFAAVFCVINFHHFLTDAAIWKLRDPKVRKILIA